MITFPKTIPNSYVILSSGCTVVKDNLHFKANDYRDLGNRCAEKMLTLLDQKKKK